MVVLIPFMGIYGAAVAIGTASLLKNSFIWWYVRRRAVWINASASVFYSAISGAASPQSVTP